MMKNLRVLITAGPTREYLDPVRYISNDSSGRMGFAIADAVRKLGAFVTLIAGPVWLPTPKFVKRIDVVTAKEMHGEVMKRFAKSDVVIMSAAVSDFRPVKFSRNKIKKTGGKKIGALKLIQNPDILSEIGKKKRSDQVIIGFAVETHSLENRARKKLKEKKCDFIVANAHTAIGSEAAAVTIFGKNGEKIHLPRLPKEELAVLIISHIFGRI